MERGRDQTLAAGVLVWGRGLACAGLRPSARLDPLVDRSMHLGQCQFKDTTDREVLKIALKVKPGAHESYVWVECSGCECGWPVPVYAEETV
jgi:hypothetical protein